MSTTGSALESCFAISDGSTKCAIQSGGFSRDPQDVDHDGRPDTFVCAHIVQVPHGADAGGPAATPPAPSSDAAGARPPLPVVPSDADCDRLGCQDMRPHAGGGPAAGGGGVSGKPDPTSGPAAPAAADTASTPATGAPTGDDMKCPAGPGPQPGPGAGGAGAPAGHGPGDNGTGGAGAPAGHGPGGPGAGGAGAR